MKLIPCKMRHLLLVSVALFLASCGGVDSDAEKAAKLTLKSIQQANELKLDDARNSYREACEIIAKYDDHKKREEFYKLYRQYRDKDKYPSHNE